MASKPLMIASLLGASIGVPYFSSRASLRGTEGAATTTPPPASASMTAAPAGQTSPLQAPSLTALPPVTPNALPTASARSPSAEQALRFDVTKDWVYRSWDRKTTAPTDLGLIAVRVPLVSGTQSASLAGSLTYYFNINDKIEHISFHGRTGNPSRLIQFLTRTYGLAPVAAPPGEYLYQVADRGGVHSELRTREELVTAPNAQRNFAVALELARPGSKRYLPPQAPQLNIQPAPPPPASEAAAAQGATSETTGTSSSTFGKYFDKFRYANPQEEGHVLWKRWPN